MSPFFCCCLSDFEDLVPSSAHRAAMRNQQRAIFSWSCCMEPGGRRTAAQCAIVWSAPDTVPRYKGSCFKPFRATAIASWPSNKNTSPDPRCLAKMKETPPASACEVCQEICKGDRETLLAFVTFSSNQKQKPSKTAYTSGNPLPLRFSTRQCLQFVGSLVLIALQKFASGPRDIFKLSLNKRVRILLLKIGQSSQNVGPAHVI